LYEGTTPLIIQTSKGFPHHKHEGNNIAESENMTISKVLEELKKRANAHRV
jgi:hypothetical protein